MRYAVLADIHGNLPAFEAVMHEATHLGIDRHLVLGDLVGYGAFPNECVAAVADLGAPAVAGNHDLMAIGRLSDERCIRAARTTLRWTRTVLNPAARGYLERMPPRYATDDGVVCAHGTLDDPQEYLTTPEQAVVNLGQLTREHPGASVLLVGHTHRPWACGHDGETRRHEGTIAIGHEPIVLNPGAVGQVRGGPPVARFMVLDTVARTATFVTVPYDVKRTRAALRQHGLPRGTHRLRRSALGGLRRLLRRV